MTQPDGASDCSFCDTEWVHIFERDTTAGAVFVPAGTDIPLSRRPRERLVLNRDGSAVIRGASPDDRLADRPASWSREEHHVVVRAVDGRVTWRIVQHSRDRLLIRMD
jgi:hypothetical protein